MGKMKEITTTNEELVRLMTYHSEQFWNLKGDHVQHHAHVIEYHNYKAFDYECQWADQTRAYDDAAAEEAWLMEQRTEFDREYAAIKDNWC